MKKLLLIILIILLNLTFAFGQDFNFPTDADYPQLKKYGQKIEDFVPKKWTMVAKEFGDLNGDKISDCAIVIKGNDKNFLNKNDGLGVPEFDTNPRMLVILFKNAAEKRYEIAEQSNTFIITPDSPTMTEPFQSVKIKDGVLQLNFESWYSAGSWGTSQSSYKFRYINGEFALIGADKKEFMRNSGDMEIRSYNFLTNKMSVTTGDEFDQKVKKQVKWKTYKVGKLKTFRSFVKPFGWEIEQDYCFIIKQDAKAKGLVKRKMSKVLTLKEVANRDEQFQKIAEKVAEFKLKRLPILSIDTKKKKFIGQFYRNGKSYCRQAVKVYENYHIQPL